MCQLRRIVAPTVMSTFREFRMHPAGTANAARSSTRLRQLLGRTDRVLSVLHPPNAACARIMEKAGCEVGFVGTGGVVGAYTGLADVGSLTMLECVTVAGWIAQSVDFPVIMDGDTGHGGPPHGARMHTRPP